MRSLLSQGALRCQLPALRRLFGSRGICRQQYSTDAGPDFNELDMVAWANEPAPLKRALTHWKLNQRFEGGELGVTGPRVLATAQDVAKIVKPLEWPGAGGMGSVWDRGSEALVSALASGHVGFWSVLDYSVRSVLEHQPEKVRHGPRCGFTINGLAVPTLRWGSGGCVLGVGSSTGGAILRPAFDCLGLQHLESLLPPSQRPPWTNNKRPPQLTCTPHHIQLSPRVVRQGRHPRTHPCGGRRRVTPYPTNATQGSAHTT